MVDLKPPPVPVLLPLPPAETMNGWEGSGIQGEGVGALCVESSHKRWKRGRDKRIVPPNLGRCSLEKFPKTRRGTYLSSVCQNPDSMDVASQFNPLQLAVWWG